MPSIKISRPSTPKPSRSFSPLSRIHRRFTVLVLGGIMALGFSSCRTIDQDWDQPVGEAYVPTNFYQKGPMPASVRRVAVLPLYSQDWDHLDLEDLQANFAAELGKQNKFEVVVVQAEHMKRIFGTPQVSSGAKIPADEFATLINTYGADAVLFTDLTTYYPYRPIVMGVRCKLVESRTADILWSFDTVFDSGNPAISTAARRFHLDETAPPYPLQNSSSILQSPQRFSKYVADAAFTTIPER